MTDKQYAAFKRAAFTAKKVEARQITAVEPRDLELIKSLLKDRDGYIKAAIADKRTESQARQDVDRCERVVNKLTAPGPATCAHGQPLCPACEAEKAALRQRIDADIEAAFS